MATSVRGQQMEGARVAARIAGLAVVEGAALGWWFVLRPQPGAMESVLPMGVFLAAMVALGVVVVAALVLGAARRLDGPRQKFVQLAYLAGVLAGLVVGYLVQPVGGPV